MKNANTATEVLYLNSEQESSPFLKGENLVNTVLLSEKKSITFLQEKIFNAILKISFETFPKNQTSLFLGVGTIKRIINLNSNNFDVIYDALDRLNDIQCKSDSPVNSELFRPMEVSFLGGGVHIKLHENIFSLQESSNSFIQLDFKLIDKLKSYSTFKLYEIILLNEENRIRNIIPLDKIYLKLQIEEGKYTSDFNQFNRYVIKPAIAKISLHAPYKVVFQKHKFNTKVNAISFRTVPKSPQDLYASVDIKLAEARLSKIGIPLSIINYLFEKYSLVRILTNMEHVEAINKRNPVRSLNHYVMAAIKENYANVTEKIMIDLVAPVNKEQDYNERKEKVNIDLLEIKNIASKFENTENQQNQIKLKEFEIFLDNVLPFLKQVYEKNKFGSTVVCLAFMLFEKQKPAD